MFPKTPYTVVIDFEATCGNGLAGSEVEIIEFAAIMVETKNLTPYRVKHPAGCYNIESAFSSCQLESCSEFVQFVRPAMHPILSAFCKDLTSISQQQTDWSPHFPSVLHNFDTWLSMACARSEVTFASWGEFDKKQLVRECLARGTPYPFENEHFNVKNWAAERLGLKKGSKSGLAFVIEKLGLKFLGCQHRGIDDCRNILRVMQELKAPELQTPELQTELQAAELLS